MAEDPLIHQRFVEGTNKHGDMLGEARRAHENTQHARDLEGRAFNWKAAILLFILIAGAAGLLFLLSQMAGPADYLP